MANRLQMTPSREPYIKKNIKQRQLDGSLKKLDIRHYEYKDKNISINDIEQVARNLQEKLQKDKVNAKIQIIIATPQGHRSDGFYDSTNADINLWNPTNLTYNVLEVENKNNKLIEWYDDGNATPKEFWFNIIWLENKGGSDLNNDCLYNALKKLLPVKLVEVWQYPSHLKKYLRIKRDDLVNANNHMDKIEQKLNVQIFISGDVTRVPKINAQTSIHLLLQNSHYKILPDSIKQKVKGVSYKERIPIIYHYDHANNNYILYDGTEIYNDTVENVNEMCKEMIQKPLSYPYVLIKEKNKENIINEYNNFIKEADKLKTLTKGLVNMYKTGTIKDTALTLFNHYTKAIAEPDVILGVEAMFIFNTYRAGIMYSSPYGGEAYKYDVSSMYPALLSGDKTYPYKEGQFKILTKDDMDTWKKDGKKYFMYGIYKCIISGKINPALFKINKLNYYTHTDLEKATKLGYNIELIQDGTCNHTYYDSKTRISGRQLFKHYVELLYPIKQEHDDFKYSKKLLNIIWGALCEKKIHRKIPTIVDDEEEEQILEYNEEIYDMQYLGKNKMTYKTNKCDNAFVSGFARLMPFLTAFARNMISDLIIENVDDVNCVKRIHTDSILSSVPLKNIFPNKKDAKLGDLGYEGYYKHCLVKNMRQPEGDLIKPA